MRDKPENFDLARLQGRIIDTVIRIAIIFALVVWCYDILKPFLYPIVWGVIIAVATNSSYKKLQSMLGGREKFAAVVMTLIMLTVLIVPVVALTGGMVDGIYLLAEEIRTGTLKIPPPPESVSSWPLVGAQIDSLWRSASDNIADVLHNFAPQLKAAGGWLLSMAADAGFAVLKFIASVIVAGILLAFSGSSVRAVKAFATRLAGDKGVEFVEIAAKTVNGVTRGILGVALIQATLSGFAFLVVDIPAAGLWAFFVLLFAIIQIGIFPVTIPAVIYVLSRSEPVTAFIFLVFIIIVSVMDNVLKPLLMGKGALVPIPIIFLGAIGGFIASGIIGLFTGAIILSIGYTLYQSWLSDGDATTALAGSEDKGSRALES